MSNSSRRILRSPLNAYLSTAGCPLLAIVPLYSVQVVENCRCLRCGSWELVTGRGLGHERWMSSVWRGFWQRLDCLTLLIAKFVNQTVLCLAVKLGVMRIPRNSCHLPLLCAVF